MLTCTRLDDGCRKVDKFDCQDDTACVRVLVAKYGLYHIDNISLRRSDGSLCVMIFQDIVESLV